MRTHKTRDLERAEKGSEHQVTRESDKHYLSGALAIAADKYRENAAMFRLVADGKAQTGENENSIGFLSPAAAKNLAEQFEMQEKITRDFIDLVDRADSVAFLNVEPEEDFENDAAPSMGR